MGSRVKRRAVWILGAILLVTSLILLASVSLIVPVQAVTVESPYPYGDATENGLISAADIARVKKIILGQQPLTPTADATANGLISAADIARVKKIILGQATATTRHQATYNFSTRAGTSRIAMWNNVAALPSDNFDGEAGWTEATSAQYTSLSAEGGGIWTIGGSAGTYTALQCKFPIDEAPNASDITSIGVTLVGSSQTEGDLLQFWAWNFDTTSWTQVGSDMSMTNSTATYTAWTAWGEVYANYIDVSGYMYILVIHNTLDKDLNVDYVELAISTPTECTTPPDDTPPADVTDLEATDFDTTYVTLSWTAPANDGSDAGSGNASEYDIRYSTSTITEANFGSATECTGEPAPGTPNTTQTFTVTNLTAGQIYYFALKTADDIPNWSNISNVISETPRQPLHKVGDWWMWAEYYNDEGEEGVENYAYFIQNVRETGNLSRTIYWDADDTTGNLSYPLTLIDFHYDYNKEEDGGYGRTRVVAAPIVGSAKNVAQDTKSWVQASDNSMWVTQDVMPMAYGTLLGMGNGDIPTHTYEHYNSAAYPWGAWTGTQDWGYPFEVGDTWQQHLDQQASGEHISGAGDQDMIYTFGWHVDQIITNYNISDPGTYSDIPGFSHDGGPGIYDVYVLNSSCQEYGGDAVPGACTGAPTLWYYSEEAHTYVRKFDRATYFGREENVMVAYEVGHYSATNLVVTDKTGAVDVQVTITNDGSSAAKFNVLCLLLDMDMMTPEYGQESMIDGYPVFPDIHVPDSANWPYFNAIQQTSELAPGASTTLTWTDIYTAGTGQWRVWCQGLTDDWTN